MVKYFFFPVKVHIKNNKRDGQMAKLCPGLGLDLFCNDIHTYTK